MILDERSSAAPALVAGYLAFTGRDYRINVLSSPDGTTYGDKWTLDEKSYRMESSGEDRKTVPLGPALAAGPDDWYAAWTGANGHINVQAPGKVTLDETSRVAPGLCAFGPAKLALAWVGTDRRLNVAVSEDGLFGPPVILDETSSNAPALCATGDGGLVLAWTGTDRHLNLLTGDGRIFGAEQRLDERSDHGPSLAWTPQGVAVAWTGGDRRLNVLVGSDHRVLGAKSSHGPGLCWSAGRLLIAWTGTDQRLNIDTVT